jgi:hypothetical protein
MDGTLLANCRLLREPPTRGGRRADNSESLTRSRWRAIVSLWEEKTPRGNMVHEGIKR